MFAELHIRFHLFYNPVFVLEFLYKIVDDVTSKVAERNFTMNHCLVSLWTRYGKINVYWHLRADER